MTTPILPLTVDPGDRALLRTIVHSRWLAIAGQAVAIALTHYQLGYDLPIIEAWGVIAAAALVNIAAAIRRAGRRVTARETGLHFAFDLVQLGALVWLTGGLGNPFVFLLLGPVVVAASILRSQTIFALSFVLVAIVTVMAIWPENPLPWPRDQTKPVIPELLRLGTWLALVLSCLFLAFYNFQVARQTRRVQAALAATQALLMREQRLSALGALAAAAAHELGTPLATILLAAKEVARDLPQGSAEAEDMQLIIQQTERCRIILTDLARRPDHGDTPFHHAELGALIGEIARPYRSEGVELVCHHEPSLGADAYVKVARTPELMHGLGNVLQNALQFATARVDVTIRPMPDRLKVMIEDDGPGFPPGLLSRLGDPYISTRDEQGDHLGLGVFIAQTLIERTGGEIVFDNVEGGGARVTLTWRRRDGRLGLIESEHLDGDALPIGEMAGAGPFG